MPYGYIYLITNQVNNKRYVGATRGTIYNRWKGHLKQSKLKKQKVLHTAIIKYGSENFCIEEITTASSKEELFSLETFYIAAFGTKSPKGYNLTSGGEGLNEPTDEVRAKMKAAKQNISLETRQKMSASARKKILSEEHKENLRLAASKRIITPELSAAYNTASKNWTGRRHSLESRAKMSLSHKGKVLTEQHKENIRKSAQLLAMINKEALR